MKYKLCQSSYRISCPTFGVESISISFSSFPFESVSNNFVSSTCTTAVQSEEILKNNHLVLLTKEFYLILPSGTGAPVLILAQ